MNKKLNFSKVDSFVCSIEKGKEGLVANLYILDQKSRKFKINSFPTSLTEYENKTVEVELSYGQYKQIFTKQNHLLVATVESFIGSDVIADLDKVEQKGKTFGVIHLGGVILTSLNAQELPKDLFIRRNHFKVNVHSDEEFTIVRYANLHQHTEYSLLDGIVKIKDLSKKSEYCAAVTDHGNMYGYLEWRNAMEKQGKKPIIGEEFYVETLRPRISLKKTDDLDETMFDFNEYVQDNTLQGDHLIVLAKNDEGLSNLIKLSSLAFDHIYKKPHLMIEDLKKYADGLIITSACIGSTLGRCLKNALKCYQQSDVIQALVDAKGIDFFRKDPIAIKAIMAINGGNEMYTQCYENNMQIAIDFVDLMLQLVGEDFYFEYQDHHFDLEHEIMNFMIKFRNELYPNVKIIAGCDAHYLNKEDAYMHEVWLCNQTKKTMNNEKRMRFSGDGYYVHTSEEMVEMFDAEYLDNTLEIADKIQYSTVKQEYHLPIYPLPEGFKSDIEYFKHRCREGFIQRFNGTPKVRDKEYLSRMQTEIDTILNMGWPSYFLIVSDFIAWAKDEHVKENVERYFPSSKFDTNRIPEKFLKDYPIYIGPGRGSAAGSLVCYCLQITDIDPIKYGLLFERFLSPDRVSMPDIDTDIEDERRQEVLEYVRFKYGAQQVSGIITFGTAAAKSAIKSAARCLDLPLDLSNAMASLVPGKPGMTLQKAINQNPDLKLLVEQDQDAKRIWDIAVNWEGLKTNCSQHACFTADSRVCTSQGMKPIAKINVGDMVLTHKGRFCRVAEVMERQTDTIYEIKTSANKVIRCTGNHPFLTNVVNHEQWTSAKDLVVGKDHLLSPLPIADQRQRIAYAHESIVSVQAIKMNTKVYNLSVENDNSYTVSKIAVHNCGNLIVDKPVTMYIPQCRLKNPETNEMELVTQLEAPVCEDQGLLKMDFLGLRTLGVVHNAIDSIYKNHGVVIDYNSIPLDDVKVYEFLAKGNTAATFQLESNLFTGMVTKGLSDIEGKVMLAQGDDAKLHELGEVGFSRLADMNALGRPGPIEFVPQYCENIMDESKITYDLPEVEPFLKDTYGIILFQEQVMRIVRALAGFSAGQSDTIRKAMGKKKKEIVDEYGEYFIHGNAKLNIKGCVANGIDEEKARKLWATMAKFSEYAFNKSHAVAYSLNSIRTAWLSYYYPSEYMCAVLNSYLNNAEKIQQYLYVCSQKNITILPPSLNKSDAQFSLEGACIRSGLTSLKGVGSVGEQIIDERTHSGEFTSFSNFLYRMTKYHHINKTSLTSLIYCGLLDEYGYTRKDLISNMDLISQYMQEVRALSSKSYSIFDALHANNPSIKEIDFIDVSGKLKIKRKEYDQLFKLINEKAYAGRYITGHPMDQFPIKKIGKVSMIADVLSEFDQAESGTIKKDVKIAGILSAVEAKYSKNGKLFYVVEVEDKSGTMSCVYFPDTTKEFDPNTELLSKNEPVRVIGYVKKDDFGTKMTISRIFSLKSILFEGATDFVIPFNKLPLNDQGNPDATELNMLLKYAIKNGHKNIYIQDEKGKLNPIAKDITITNSLHEQICNLVGKANFRALKKDRG